jgi:hypothetical protein
MDRPPKSTHLLPPLSRFEDAGKRRVCGIRNIKLE